MEHARAFEPVQNGRICIEKINGPFLFGDKRTPVGICGGPLACYRTRLADDPRKRHFRPLHAKRLGPVRLMPLKPQTVIRCQSADVLVAFEQWLTAESAAGIRLVILEGPMSSGKSCLTK
jgi:hypothetical protein